METPKEEPRYSRAKPRPYNDDVYDSLKVGYKMRTIIVMYTIFNVGDPLPGFNPDSCGSDRTSSDGRAKGSQEMRTGSRASI